MMVEIDSDKIDKANEAVRALGGISDLLLNQIDTTESMGMVRPENLLCLLDVVIEKLEKALAV